MELPAFLELLSGVQHYQNGSNARCPAHDDGTASLSVGISDDDGKILINCHVGCTPEQVIGAMNLSFADLSPAPRDAWAELAKARVRLEGLLGQKVYLETWVKVLPKWRKSADALTRFGFPKTPEEPAWTTMR